MRRDLIVGGSGWAVAGALLLTGAAGPKNHMVANSLTITNEKGEARMILGVLDGNPALVMTDAAGKDRVFLSISTSNQNRPSLRLMGTDGQPRAMLFPGASNEGVLGLWSGDGERRKYTYGPD